MNHILRIVCIAACATAHTFAAQDITRGDVAALGSSSTVMTINQSGVYPLTTNYAGQILISANNVTLDMQGFTINGGTYGVRITGNNCTVHSGTITGAIVGLQIESNNNEIYGLDLISNGSGLRIFNGNNNLVHECRALQNTAAGFRVMSGQNNKFVNCSAIGTSGSGNAFGFSAQDGIGNTFENCLAENTATTGVSPLYAAGFLLTGTEQKSVIIECTALNSSGALNYGMLISGTVSVAQNNMIRDNQASGNSIGYRDDFAVSFTSGTNRWLGNVSSNNTTNFNIGSQFPISAVLGTGVGETENIDGVLTLTIGGPTERIERTIVDQIPTLNAPMAAKVAAMALYGITAITSSPTTLTSFKSYCLATNLTGTVFILTSSFITLDLNGHTVGSISVTNSNFLAIRNGRVYPNSSSTDGLSFSNSGNILLQNIDVAGAQNGLSFSYASANDSSLFAQNCTFNNNSLYGVRIVEGGTPAIAPHDHFYFKCSAENNGNHGFYTGCQGGRYHLCQAIANGGDGFVLETANEVGNLFIECTALNNVGTGFNMQSGSGPTNNTVGACFSKGNGTNYSASIRFGTVSASNSGGTSSAPYWQNVFE